MPVVGVAWLVDPKGLDSADFFWPNVSKILPAVALNPATGPVGVLGLEVAEVGIGLFELEVGNRLPELAARNDLLELTVSLSGVTGPDREGSGVADADRVCSGVAEADRVGGGVADADRVGGGVSGTHVNMPAKWPGCFGPELSETELAIIVGLGCRVVRLPALTS